MQTRKTYFIRHTCNLDIDEKIRKYLWEKRILAVGYPHDKRGRWVEDNRSLDPEDYDSRGKRAIRALNRLAEGGGAVFAEYWWQKNGLIGSVKPASKVIRVSGSLFFGKLFF